MMKAKGKPMTASTIPAEPLEALDLCFNYEPGALRRAGIDPRTSEGKAKIMAVLLTTLNYYVKTVDPIAGFDDERAVGDSLLAEGP
jgi:hypothetical protein